jgi:L-iditol 2-dehydrogenase
MKAAVLTEYRKIEIQDLPEPVPGPNDMLVRVMANGLCPNDYRIYAGIATWKKPPTTLGHEPSGVVVEVGSNVKDFKPGDKVAGDTSTRCGYCKPCLEGRENLCVNRRGSGNGALAEFVAGNEVYMNKFYKASFEEEAFTEPLSCVINGIKNSKVKMGDTVAIVGSGQIGLMHMQVARLCGAKTVVLDLRPERLAVAEKLGADHTIDSSKTDPVAKIKELTGGEGADKVIVAIGDSRAIDTAMRLVSKVGSVNLFASVNPPAPISVDPNLIHHEISLIGSYDKTRADLRLATRIIDEGRIDVKSLISHRFTLDRAGEAIELLGQSAGVKILVNPNSE